MNEEMFTSMQLMKPYSKKNPVHVHTTTKEDIKEFKNNMKNSRKDDTRKMMKLSNLYPKDLLFINRNMNLVRSINKRCGSLVNRINIMARYA